MTPPTFACQQMPGVTVISVAGDLEAVNADRLDAFITRARCRPGDQVVLDLSEVPFMAQSGLRVLLNVRALTRRHGGDLHLTALQESPDRLLDTTGARPVLTVHRSVEQAILAALKAANPRDERL
ncbi:STAS domain-containing protein [Nonomuraea sp. NPDC049758]|uniref:STAS domain-containing protein n=1 Tax=Nonomuraea sp. NPDC049758 TaxID=3154360 RepID=UPI00342AA9BF